jgi:hypothetical protein
MDPHRDGLLEVGEIRGKIHYKFAGELLIAVLLKGVPDREQQQKFEDILGMTASLTRAVAALDDVFACYAREQTLSVSSVYFAVVVEAKVAVVPNSRIERALRAADRASLSGTGRSRRLDNSLPILPRSPSLLKPWCRAAAA